MERLTGYLSRLANLVGFAAHGESGIRRRRQSPQHAWIQAGRNALNWTSRPCRDGDDQAALSNRFRLAAVERSS